MKKRDLHRERPPSLKIHKQPIPNPNPYLNRQHIPANPNPYPADRPYNPNPVPHPHIRQPVIIHTYSPRVIQIESHNFRQLVQRLTGSDSAAAASRNHASSSSPPSKRARVGIGNNSGTATGGGGAAAAAGQYTSQDCYRQEPLLSDAKDQSNQANVPLLAPKPVYPILASNPNPNPTITHAPNSSASSNPCAGGMGHPNSSLTAGPQRDHGSLPSPSTFDFSPSILPSPSAFSFDYPTPRGAISLVPSPAAAAAAMRPGSGPGIVARPPAASGGGGGGFLFSSPLPSPGGLGFSLLPSPGALGFDLCDLPVLSPAAYSWIEKNPAPASSIACSRAPSLPPRPPPTTTANLFPSAAPAPLHPDHHHEPLYKQ